MTHKKPKDSYKMTPLTFNCWESALTSLHSTHYNAYTGLPWWLRQWRICLQETGVWSLGWEDPLEKGMATHPSILAWRIPMDREAWQMGYNGVAKSRTPWTTLTLVYLTLFIIIIVKEVEYSIQLMYCHILHCSPCSYCWIFRSFSISALLENATMKCHTQGFTIL